MDFHGYSLPLKFEKDFPGIVDAAVEYEHHPRCHACVVPHECLDNVRFIADDRDDGEAGEAHTKEGKRTLKSARLHGEP